MNYFILYFVKYCPYCNMFKIIDVSLNDIMCYIIMFCMVSVFWKSMELHLRFHYIPDSWWQKNIQSLNRCLWKSSRQYALPKITAICTVITSLCIYCTISSLFVTVLAGTELFCDFLKCLGICCFGMSAHQHETAPQVLVPRLQTASSYKCISICFYILYKSSAGRKMF